METRTNLINQHRDAYERYVQACRDVGMPAEQLELFSRYGYVVLPSFLKFHATAARINEPNGVTEIMLDGTRASAKSHATVAQICLYDCQVTPEVKALFLRQTERAASESFGDLISRVLRNIPHRENTERILFENGSRVLIGGFKDDRDIDKYLGIEYDIIAIEEGTQISGDKHEKLRGSLRTSKQDFVPRLYITTNPAFDAGGVGHSYCKERYIVPNQQGTETFTRRFFSSYMDNPFINVQYRDYLEGLTGDLARSWRDGDWNVFAGQAFPQWKDARHVKPYQELPAHYIRWRSLDYGFTHPMVCYWLAQDTNSGRIYVYRELLLRGQTDRQQARAIKAATLPDERIMFTFASPDMWAHKNTQDVITTSADEYAAEGVILTRADNDRLNGKRKIDRLLADLPDGEPGLVVFNNCTELIRVMPNMVRAKLQPEDVEKVDGDDAYDAFRYGLTNLRGETEQRKVQQPVSSLVGLRQL